MTKFKKLKTVDSIFNLEDVSYEFYESVTNVFIQKNTIFFTLIDTLTITEIDNVKSHIVKYFYGYKCIFLKKV